MTKDFTLDVNGKQHKVNVDPDMPLLYALRDDLGLNNPHFGCGLAQCGACTVHLNGQPIRSCVTPVSAVKSEITTLEGLSKGGTLHPVQEAWIEVQVPQCGFCQNGQIMTAKALLDKNPNPTNAQIREGMARTLCRCMTYYRVQSAIQLAAAKMAASKRAEVKPVVAEKPKAKTETDVNLPDNVQIHRANACHFGLATEQAQPNGGSRRDD